MKPRWIGIWKEKPWGWKRGERWGLKEPSRPSEIEQGSSFPPLSYSLAVFRDEEWLDERISRQCVCGLVGVLDAG